MALQLIADAALLSSLFSGTNRAPGAVDFRIDRLASKDVALCTSKIELRHIVDVDCAQALAISLPRYLYEGFDGPSCSRCVSGCRAFATPSAIFDRVWVQEEDMTVGAFEFKFMRSFRAGKG